MTPSKLNYKYLIPLILIPILIIAGYFLFRPSLKPRDPDVIAKVGSREIRVEQFKNEMVRRSGSSPENFDKKKLLEEMIDYETLLVKGIEAGLDKDSEVLRSFHNLIIGKLKQRDLTPQIDGATMSDEEIAAYYNTNIKNYTQPPKVRLAMLYLKTDSGMSTDKIAEIRQRMLEAKEKALQPSSEGEKNVGFGALAIDYSEDQTSRYRGGDIGWLDEGRSYRWDAAVVSAGFSLQKIGDISDIIPTANGIYLVKLMDKAESKITPLEKVKTAINHKMLLEKRKQIEKTFQEQMRASTAIEIYPESLDKIPLPASLEKKPDGMKPPSLP